MNVFNTPPAGRKADLVNENKPAEDEKGEKSENGCTTVLSLQHCNSKGKDFFLYLFHYLFISCFWSPAQENLSLSPYHHHPLFLFLPVLKMEEYYTFFSAALLC